MFWIAMIVVALVFYNWGIRVGRREVAEEFQLQLNEMEEEVETYKRVANFYMEDEDDE